MCACLKYTKFQSVKEAKGLGKCKEESRNKKKN